MNNDKVSINMHFNQAAEVRGYRTAEQCKDYMRTEFREFFFLGVQERTNQIMPNLETIAANIDNKNLSDADFRLFIGNSIPALIKRLNVDLTS